MALLDEVRQCLHVTSTMSDVEIQMWIDGAIEDMRRCGVKDALLAEETMAPQVKQAVVLFVKGQYGYDNDEATRFLDYYNLTLAGLLNSKSNEYLFADDGEDDPTEDVGSDGDGTGLGSSLGMVRP